MITMYNVNSNVYESKAKKESGFDKDFMLLAGVTTLGDLLMAAILLK